MPQTRIEIEQVEGNRWVAEVEAGGKPGGPPFKRQPLTAGSFMAMMSSVCAAYYAQVPDDKLAEPQPQPAPAARPAPALASTAPAPPAPPRATAAPATRR